MNTIDSSGRRTAAAPAVRPPTRTNPTPVSSPFAPASAPAGRPTPAGRDEYRAAGPSKTPEQILASIDLLDTEREEFKKILRGGDREKAREIEALLNATQYLDPKGAGALMTQASFEMAMGEKCKAASIFSSRGWQAAGPEDKKRIAELVARSTTPMRDSLVKLCEEPKRLLAKDTQGQNLLENLAGIMHQKPHEALSSGGDAAGGMAGSAGAMASMSIVASVLEEVAFPEKRLGQGASGTCGAASPALALARANPSEYARLVRGLTGEAGTVRMAGGGELRLQTGHYTSERQDGRSLSESAFGNAAMEYANGGMNYDSSRDLSIEEDDSLWAKLPFTADEKETTGLLPSQSARLDAQLFGTKFSASNYTDGVGGLDTDYAALERLDSIPDHPPAFVALNVDAGDRQGGHLFAFDRIENGRVYLSSANPAAFKDFEKIGGAESGMVSLSIEAFKEKMFGAIVPDTTDRLALERYRRLSV